MWDIPFPANIGMSWAQLPLPLHLGLAHCFPCSVRPPHFQVGTVRPLMFPRPSA